MAAALDSLRYGPARGGAPDSLILLMHGYGADAHDLIDLAPAWSQAAPGALFLAPHAPEPCEGAPFGRQWFSLLDRSPAIQEAGVAAAAGVLGRFVAEEAAALGLPSGRVALMGFSQGAMTALAAGLRGAVAAPAGILAYSGRLIGAGGFVATPPVLLVHGEADEVVPVAASRQAEATLRTAGVPVRALYRPGLGHGIDEVGIAAGAEMLRGALAGESGG